MPMKGIRIMLWFFIVATIVFCIAMTYLIFFWDNVALLFNPVETVSAMELFAPLAATEAPEETDSSFGWSTASPPDATPTPTPVIALLDPGHGGIDVGADRGGSFEKDLNLKIALETKKRLVEYESDRFAVRLTRDGDQTRTLAERTEMANESSFLISIHCDMFKDSSIRGSTTFFQTHDTDWPFTSKELATIIQDSLVFSIGSRDRGIAYDDELYLLNHTTVPAILTEVGFMSNPSEFQMLMDDDYIGKAADGLKTGILTLWRLYEDE
ncbi:MAG: N-acetylmuramoyl-L-alanine amidase [Clostridiales bacterium]|nr:N-acetylmuramoyl-L-alanine amidase [Clostridiales bacterium]